MKKLLRFAGVALLALTIGVFGCGDDEMPVAPIVTVPTPPTPPPPPPVVVTMSPASQTIGVGGTVVFAVSVSGGVAGEAASWTCASSDPSKATVTMTSAGCAATAVAVGGVTITAAVTKSGATVNTAAGLTITEDTAERATLFIASIMDSDEDDEALSRRVNVELSVGLGDQMLTKLSVLVDGLVVDTLAFGGASMVAAAPEGEEGERAAQQAVHPFFLSFNSAHYNTATGEPTYMNGEHTISAKLMVASSDEPIESGFHVREFGNGDAVHVTVSGLGEGAMHSGTGQRWYGGPEAALEMTAVPVLYSGGSAASVSVTLLAFCGADAATETSETSFTFTPECDETSNTAGTDTDSAGDSPVFVIANAEVDNLGDDVFPLYLDYEGPGAPVFRANPNKRLEGWINPAVAFTSTSGRNSDSWLRKLSGADAGGVGGYTTQLRVGEDLDEALAATASSSPAFAASREDVYCVVASALDDLGNESARPDEDDGACKTAEEYKGLYGKLAAALKVVSDGGSDATDVQQDEIDDFIDDLVEAALLAGFDDEAPNLTFTTSASSPLRSAREFQVAASDEGRGRSGIHDAPVLARVTLRNADETLCGSDIRDDGEEEGSNTVTIPGDPDEDCENTSEELDVSSAGGAAKLATTAIFGDGDNEIGFYTFTALARDKAGNMSDEIERVVLNDTEEPSVGITARIPGSGADEAFDVTVLMADDLSLRDVRGTGVYGVAGAYNLRLVGMPIDPFNAPQLTQERILPLADVLPLLRLYNAGAMVDYQDDGTDADKQNLTADGIDLASIAVRLRDQSGAAATDDASITVAPLTGFSYTLPAIATDDEATADVDEQAVARAARAALTAEKEIFSFAITDFDGAGPMENAAGNMVSDNDVTIDLEVEVRGNERGGDDGALLFENPFERVDFYVSDAMTDGHLHKIDSAVGFSAELGIDYGTGQTARTNTDLTDDRRVWTYAVEVSGDDLESVAKGTERDGPFERSLYAFGVTSKGKVALVSAMVPVEIEER